jgi:hypothetical protein
MPVPPAVSFIWNRYICPPMCSARAAFDVPVTVIVPLKAPTTLEKLYVPGRTKARTYVPLFGIDPELYVYGGLELVTSCGTPETFWNVTVVPAATTRLGGENAPAVICIEAVCGEVMIT